MVDLLYAWPESAKFGRVVPKTKFYDHTSMPPKVKEKFVSEIQRIVWAYKLAENTVNLRPDENVTEIQVFRIDAKGDDISQDVLFAIDKAIPFPIIFEINNEHDGVSSVRMVAAHKEFGGSRPKLSSYFGTEWVPLDFQRSPMPVALDIPGLYAVLLQPLLPIKARAHESLSEATERINEIAKIKREIAALETRLRKEQQFNRKLEIRRTLKQRIEDAGALLGGSEELTRNDERN